MVQTAEVVVYKNEDLDNIYKSFLKCQRTELNINGVEGCLVESVSNIGIWEWTLRGSSNKVPRIYRMSVNAIVTTSIENELLAGTGSVGPDAVDESGIMSRGTTLDVQIDTIDEI